MAERGLRRLLAAAAVLVVAFATVGSSASIAHADVAPAEAVYRPSLGWACWIQRTTGDFDGDGRTDAAVLWDRLRRQRPCQWYDGSSRWHVAVLPGTGRRVQRPVPCGREAASCHLSVGDLDRDGFDELFVETCCVGAAVVSNWHVYSLAGARLVPPIVPSPVAGVLGSGELVLTDKAGSHNWDGFGCKTHPNGRRVLIVYSGEHDRLGNWRFERVRARLEGGSLRVLGVRAFVRRMPENRVPAGRGRQACFRF